MGVVLGEGPGGLVLTPARITVYLTKAPDFGLNLSVLGQISLYRSQVLDGLRGAPPLPPPSETPLNTCVSGPALALGELRSVRDTRIPSVLLSILVVAKEAPQMTSMLCEF